MHGLLAFVTRRLITRAFWLLVVVTFFGVVMYDLRSSYKDQIFQEAIATLKKSGWKNWNPKTPWED